MELKIIETKSWTMTPYLTWKQNRLLKRIVKRYRRIKND